MVKNTSAEMDTNETGQAFDPQKLARDSDRIVRHPSVAAEKRLRTQVCRALETGDDNLLDRSLQLTQTSDGESKLREEITTAATFFNRVTGPGKSRQTAVLLAIPLVITVNGERHDAVPARVPELDGLADSFTRYGLIDAEGEKIVLLDGLWPREALDQLSFSDVYQLATELQSASSGNVDLQRVAQTRLPAGEEESVPTDSSVKVLRYLIGMAFYQGDRGLPFLGEEVSERVDAWHEAVSPLLGDLIEARVLAQTPDAFYVAKADGVTALRLASLEEAMDESLAHHVAVPSSVFVAVSAHGDDTRVRELRIAAYVPEQLDRILGFVWELTDDEDPNTIANMIEQLMEGFGIEHVAIVGEVLPLDMEPETNEPVFVTPDREQPFPAPSAPITYH